ncbi:MAG: alanine-glyoxylate transaminase / serine-glyoxylate transaminase / serine-pyruvate transaminase [Rhodospirillaceae bacterium]|nr:MAG: alanine-glyoxylate transaminase / serine-glyoxylate transaminase / serine-pyruvate transaminase [Rhodospirillaceae bacterium]
MTRNPSGSFMSFLPPRRILMGPGPSDVHPRVLAAMARPTIGHLDPAFVAMMDDIKTLLQYAFHTDNDLILAVSAPGSAGMETCFVNLIEPGDRVLVCINGVFGGRMKENVERCGAIPVAVEFPWGEAVDPVRVAVALGDHPGLKAVCFVHAETSTGAMSDAGALCKLAHAYGALAIVDVVTSLGGIPVLVDAWRADAVYSSSQKCLSCTPGLAPVTFSPRAVAVLKTRRTKVPSWFLDLALVMTYWGSNVKRAYHHTAPVNALYGLHEALVMLHEEGLEVAWRRHALHHQALRAGLEVMGLHLLVAESCRLPQLNTVLIPAGVNDTAVREQLLQRYGLEIGAGLGPLAGKVWRIGLMGQSATATNVLTCLSALETTLSAAGAPITTGVALPAATAVLFS